LRIRERGGNAVVSAEAAFVADEEGQLRIGMMIQKNADVLSAKESVAPVMTMRSRGII